MTTEDGENHESEITPEYGNEKIAPEVVTRNVPPCCFGIGRGIIASLVMIQNE